MSVSNAFCSLQAGLRIGTCLTLPSQHQYSQLVARALTGQYTTHPFDVLAWTAAATVRDHQAQVDDEVSKFHRVFSTDMELDSEDAAVCELYRAVLVPANAVLADQHTDVRWRVAPSVKQSYAADTAPGSDDDATAADDSRPAKKQLTVKPDTWLVQGATQGAASAQSRQVLITVEAKQSAVLHGVTDLPQEWHNGNRAVQQVVAQAFGQMAKHRTALGVIVTLEHVWLLRRQSNAPGTLQVCLLQLAPLAVGQYTRTSLPVTCASAAALLAGTYPLGLDIVRSLHDAQSPSNKLCGRPLPQSNGLGCHTASLDRCL